ncbi:spore coat protein, partial [Candidatus Micrarchaeota archaeon]|nr:spore coat protein [Candidatus Micrarchaeota archaeon]
LAEDFADNEKIIVVLGDNIIEDSIKDPVKEFEKSDSAFIFLKEVPDAERFGVAELQGKKVVSIEEKPKKPKSNFAVTGIYMYPSEVFNLIKTLKPSARGELEITDVNNEFIKKGKLKANFLKGFWSDAGTFESLFRASSLVKEKEKK